MQFIPYGRQSIEKDDIDAVVETMQSDFLTTGPKVVEFEDTLCELIGASYAVAVANGTAALHLAALALLQPGDRVLTTPISFLATSNALLYVGAEPVFVDIAEDGNIDLDICIALLENDPAIRGLFAVHFSGNPVNQQKLAHIKKRFGIIIVEDCAHAIGAYDSDIQAGSCTNSDASIFSFHPVKHITTGEGGAVMTNDANIFKKLQILRAHGIARKDFEYPELALDEKGNPNPWYYEMHALGFNYRITDIQCALGLSQLNKLPSFLARRRKLAKAYDMAFSKTQLVTPLYTFKEGSAYHLYVIKIDFSQLTITKAELFVKMREKNIGLQLHYIPIYMQPFYRENGFANTRLPTAENYYRDALSLPLYPAMSDEEQNYVVTCIMECLDDARR